MMGLESERVADAAEMAKDNRRAKSERRGKDRRLGKTRINQVAPRHSLMKALGASATALSFAVFAIVITVAVTISETTPWIALLVTGMAVVTSVFGLMLGSIEQRLIEIRLELMMANGGMRQADRRAGDRRSEPQIIPQPTAVTPTRSTTSANIGLTETKRREEQPA